MNESGICSVNDSFVVQFIGTARERVVFVAPGVSDAVAAALDGAWRRLGAKAVSVVLDVDPEVCRLGYGTLKGIEILQAAAQEFGQPLCKQPKLRIGIVVADERTLVFSPTPLLVEDGPPDSLAPGDAGSGNETPPNAPNAIIIGGTPPEVERDLGSGPEGASTRVVGLDTVPPKEIEDVKRDIEENPPVKFDLARQVRVFNAQLEFVELELHGCYVSRKTASISPDLMGLANDEATKNRLRSSFRVIGPNDAVDADKSLSEKALHDERKRIQEKFLTALKGFGTVILRSNKSAFEAEVETLRGLVKKFQDALKAKLGDIMERNALQLAEALFPSVAKNPPERWTRTLGPNPKPDALKAQLLDEVRRAFGEVDAVISEMKVNVLFKGVTFETLKDETFVELARERFPSLRIHEEYKAARAANN